MIELTQRAQDFLATLDRDELVPLPEVVAMLAAKGVEPFPAWLSFHEQFAGYWESLSEGQYAIWGLALVNVSGNWAAPRTVTISFSKNRVPLNIECADAHPSHDYLLRPDGTFLGPPFLSESFAIKVERNALMWAFVSAGPVERIFEIDGVSVREHKQALIEELMLEAVEYPTLKLLGRP